MKKINTLLLLSSLSLAGCGGGGGGSTPPVVTPPTTTYTTSNGYAFDYFIKGATVFADLNKNGILDASEPSTTTDSTGKYTLAVDTKLGTDYVVVVKGGTDIATDKPFTGVLKASHTDAFASPATTLVQEFKAAGAANPTESARVFLGLPVGANLAADPTKDTALYVASTQAMALVNALANAASAGEAAPDMAAKTAAAFKAVAESVQTNAALKVDSGVSLASATLQNLVPSLAQDDVNRLATKTAELVTDLKEQTLSTIGTATTVTADSAKTVQNNLINQTTELKTATETKTNTPATGQPIDPALIKLDK